MESMVRLSARRRFAAHVHIQHLAPTARLVRTTVDDPVRSRARKPPPLNDTHRARMVFKTAGRNFDEQWRRERDSNPRYSFLYTHFPGVRLQPLGHPSVRGPGTQARERAPGAARAARC